jgi:hypothetical protein
MKAKNTALILTFLMAFLGSLFIVFAQEDTSPSNKLNQDEDVSCQDMQIAFDKKVDKFLMAEPTYTYKYQVLWLKTAEIARKADVMDYDTKAVYSNLDDLDKLTAEYTANFDDFIKKMATARTYLCSTNEKLYVNAIQNAKDSLAKVRESTQQISDLYQDEMRGNLLSLQQTKDTQNE